MIRSPCRTFYPIVNGGNIGFLCLNTLNNRLAVNNLNHERSFFMRSLIMWAIGVPIPFIIIYILFF